MYGILQNETEKLDDFLTKINKGLDDQAYEDTFVVWEHALTEKCRSTVKHLSDQVFRLVVEEGREDVSDVLGRIEPFNNSLMKEELVVHSLVLRVFNKDPTVFINVQTLLLTCSGICSNWYASWRRRS